MTASIRCAIYTRKSTDDGLEQEFNSIDAQREACEAYIKSQIGLGWKLVRTRYDDGGISGGTMNRPALRALLADIECKKVDLVVVYKVDRLTRSLTDFARIVDVFDENSASFVSITQQFNTTTSMGRLTLNMLLSFAQFEREVTGERIRDKIAASKKKGMWMGGPPPLGFDVIEKKLIVNAKEAETVRQLYRLYLELGSVRALKAEAARLGLVTKRRRRDDRITGGKPFSRGNLYRLLHNALYVGEIPHKGQNYPGQHASIIDRQTWDAVHQLLSENASARQANRNARSPHLLTGLTYDETGHRLCPTHANKKGRRYRYYISKRLMQGNSGDNEAEGGWRIPAKTLESVVVEALRTFLLDERCIHDELLQKGANPDRLRLALTNAANAADQLNDRQTLQSLIHRVTLHREKIRLEIKRSGLASLLAGVDATGNTAIDGVIVYTLPVQLRRRGVESKLVLETSHRGMESPDDTLIAFISRVHIWSEQLVKGTARSIGEIAAQDGIHPSDVGRHLQLAFLAPDIIEAILVGRQPLELTAQRLRRVGALPLDWTQQRVLFGFKV